MKAIQIKLARKHIASPGYRTQRMEQINRRITEWITAENTSNSNKMRQFCRDNQQMYLRRYEYYLKRT